MGILSVYMYIYVALYNLARGRSLWAAVWEDGGVIDKMLIR